MKRTSLIVLTLLSIPLCSFSRTASISDDPYEHQPPHFYERHAEGWYWYKDPEPQKEELLKKKEPETVKQSEASVPEPFSARWVREMLPKYMDVAWNNPTPENVEAYFLLQRFAMDRSQKFAQVAQRVVVGNPYLDETNRRPIASYAIPYVDREAGKSLDDLVKKVADKAGFFFFFKSDCPYCEAQAPVLKYLESDGFDVLAISIDGGQLRSAQFANTRINSGQAEQLGVTATPALFLVSAEGQFTALGQGLLSYSDLKSRILIVAAREGWITEEEINATRPIMNGNDLEHDLSEKLPQMLNVQDQSNIWAFRSERTTRQLNKLNEMRSQPLQAFMDAEGFIEPKKLLDLLNDDNRLSGELTENE